METVLVLRTCRADMSSPSNVKFRWPESGPVEAPDWKPTEECGNGLHGALWGEGVGSLFCWEPDARWLVVAVDPATIVDLRGKVKYPRGEVVHCGDRLSATAYLAANGGASRAVIGGTATAGYRGTATAGYRGTATAGYSGTATAGYRGTATAGYMGEIRIRWWDGSADRYRTAVGYIGEDGLEPGVMYRLVAGKFMAVVDAKVPA